MKREVKLGSHTRSELDCLSLQVSAAGFPDCVFVALFRIAVKTIKEQVAECIGGFALTWSSLFLLSFKSQASLGVVSSGGGGLCCGLGCHLKNKQMVKRV